MSSLPLDSRDGLRTVCPSSIQRKFQNIPKIPVKSGSQLISLTPNSAAVNHFETAIYLRSTSFRVSMLLPSSE